MESQCRGVLKWGMRNAKKARAHLEAADPRLADVIARIGDVRLAKQTCTPFESIARAIVYQQLSGKAAATIFGRLAAKCGGPVERAALESLSDGDVRACGISRQKLGYLRDLAARAKGGMFALERLSALDDEALIVELTQIKGVGRWTVQMFLAFYLHRPDVLPTGDLGIRKAAQKIYRLRKLPEPERLEKLAAPWRPFRTAACWYLWRSLDSDPKIGD